MKSKLNLKTVIIFVILILVGVLGVVGMNTVKTFLGSAAAGMEPKVVAAKAGGDGRSATVTWSSDDESMGIVEYGTTPASLLLRAVETAEVTSHSLALTPLKPGVTYYYRIRVGDEVFDNNGIPYSFKTGTAVAAATPRVTVAPTRAAAGEVDCDQGLDYDLDNRISFAEKMCCKNRLEIATAGCKAATDYDCDGVVDASDTTCCQTRLGAKTAECSSTTDYDCDGKIRAGDWAECTKIKKGEI